MNYDSMKHIAAPKGLSAVRIHAGPCSMGGAVSVAPPSPVIFFFGASDSSHCVAEAIAAPLDHMNTSAEPLHYKLLLRCK